MNKLTILVLSALTMLTLSQIHEDTVENDKKGYRDCIEECKEENMNPGDLEFGNPEREESLKYLEECIKERCLQNLMGNKFNLDPNYYRNSPDALHRQSTDFDLLNDDGQDF
ncbi:uncharacterized protein LOC134705332 [Mytilus trossulus]|uniref:uncharacterized protein LOC134705332 n=1 Tax=Mytilus trossulus TaxID=6551 RepID=UPI0030063D84